MSDRPSDNSSNNVGPDRCGEGQGLTQVQGQRATEPDLGHRDPAIGQIDDQSRPSDTGGRRDYGQQGQQGLRRQVEQTGGDTTLYGAGGDRDPQLGTGWVRPRASVESLRKSSHPLETMGLPPVPVPEPGLATGIHGGGGFGKPTTPERVMGGAEKAIGKATGNIKMYEKGQEHQAGGY